MQKVRFKNNDEVYDVIMSLMDNNRLYIKFNNSVTKNIFNAGFVELNEHNLVEQSDFSNMKYVYRDFNDGVQFILTESKNDVYVAPVEPEIPSTKPTTPYEPTLEDVMNTKINELSRICYQNINKGVDVEINGVIEHFSYSESIDQNNIKELFDVARDTGMDVYYHADGGDCKAYTAKQMIEIYSKQSENKLINTTYFNQMKMYIETLTDKDVISSITYGDELTGKYLETFNEALQKSKLSLETMIANDLAKLGLS